MKLKIGLFALVLIAAACGGDDDAESAATSAAPITTAAPAPTTVPPTTAPPATTAAPDAGPAGDVVALGASSLGDILVDSSGNTLYLFVPDAQGPSACYDGCAEAWPPLVGGLTAGDGVDAALVGSVARDDGSEQATYNGWPLYYFANDAAAGDTNGQGINEVWYVLDAAGDAIAG